jgi:PAS domain S-box-containing protein
MLQSAQHRCVRYLLVRLDRHSMSQMKHILPIDYAATLGQHLFEHNPDCMMLLDGDDRLLAINRNGADAMGTGDAGRVAGRPWRDLWPAQAHAALDAALARARREGSAGFSAARPGSQGAPRWWEVRLSALPAAGGAAAQLVAVALDVTEARRERARPDANAAADADADGGAQDLDRMRDERARLLKELQAARQRIGEVFMRAPAFMCMLAGPDHVIEHVNERYRELVGERPLLGLATERAVPELVPQGLIAMLDRVYATGEPYAASDLRLHLQRRPEAAPEARYLDLVFIALRDADGSITGLLGHGVDQTHRKLAEIALHDSRERFEKIVSQAATGVVEMDVNGTVTFVNRRFRTMLGYDEAELVGRSILDVTGPDSVEKTALALGGVLATGEGFQIDKHYRRKDGSLISATSSVNAIRGASGAYQAVVAIVLDTTARKAAEDQLRRLADDLAEADRRKTEFLATLAHELRNPLAPIRSGLGVMRLNRDLPAGMVRVREMMERQVTHMVHLIDDLLDVARISGGKLNLRMEGIDLNRVLASAVETSLPLIEAARHELVLDLPDATLRIDGDATRIAQVVSNLLNNAAKYTPAGGRIGLSLRAQAGQAIITVTDTGIGIPAHALDTVFEMFSQVGSGAERAQGGLGIGLSLVRQLVQLHGGSVEAHSGGAGSGSRFTVHLPLAPGVPETASGEPAPRADAAPQAPSLRVLVVDDNVDAALTLAMILDIEGYTTGVAHSGAEALEAAAAFRPAVVFLDIGMPGMDGYQTAAALRRLPGLDTPCLVALTGWGAEHDRARSREAGFDHHLTKPVDLGTVQKLLADMAAAADGSRPPCARAH